jgi:hypothetical protein
MSSFPLLTTQRTVLTSFSTFTDASAVFAYGCDPEVARFTSWMPHNSPADSAAWIEQIKDSDSADFGRRHHCWAIRIRRRRWNGGRSARIRAGAIGRGQSRFRAGPASVGQRVNDGGGRLR